MDNKINECVCNLQEHVQIVDNKSEVFVNSDTLETYFRFERDPARAIFSSIVRGPWLDQALATAVWSYDGQGLDICTKYRQTLKKHCQCLLLSSRTSNHLPGSTQFQMWHHWPWQLTKHLPHWWYPWGSSSATGRTQVPWKWPNSGCLLDYMLYHPHIAVWIQNWPHEGVCLFLSHHLSASYELFCPSGVRQQDTLLQ